MDKGDLIQEFETNVIEFTNKCSIKLDNSDSIKNEEIFNEFQNYLADQARNIIHKAIANDIDDRISIVEKITEVSIKYAEELKSKVQ